MSSVSLVTTEPLPAKDAARYAQVAVPVPFEGAFTYRVPPECAVAVGARVLVPWRKRTLIGVVTELTNTAPASDFEIRDLALVLDATPIISAPLLNVARWTASYYQAPLGDVMRALLPPASDVVERKRLVRANTFASPADQQLFEADDNPVGSGATLLRAAQLGITLQSAIQRFGGSAVQQAIRAHSLEIEQEYFQRTPGRTQRFYVLRDTDAQAAESNGRKRRRTAQQQQILDLLAGGPIASTDLPRSISVSGLRTLIRDGYVKVEEREAPPVRPDWAPRSRVEQLNSSQSRALAAIDEMLLAKTPEAAPRVALLHGVTGSGKTAVYLGAIESALRLKRTALLLVPEIGLTPAVFADFEHAFPGVVSILHSGLSDAERAQHWFRAQRGDATVIIGTRSAVFAPVPRLGLIIVDEEHDGAYKQQESPRYHARDLAVLRGKLEGAVVVLGSATPSLESYSNAQSGRYRLLEMLERVEKRPLPLIRLVDMAEEFRKQTGNELNSAPMRRRLPRKDDASEDQETAISAELAEALRLRFERGEQSMVLINRRGYAPVVLCRSCGATVQCRDCSVALTFHRRQHHLLCHLCGFSSDVPSACPACGSAHLYFIGIGSEKVEAQLAALLPRARIARVDRDTAHGRKLTALLRDFREHKYDILVGTQMIAKGHDIPNVTFVGVVNADGALNFPDFRSAEKTFQLLTQVAGRAGRGDLAGEVIFQVLHPQHYSIEAALRGEYRLFYSKEARFRRAMHYPPFAALAVVQTRAADYDEALGLASQVGRFFQQLPAELLTTIRIIGPVPAAIARLKTRYRFQFLLKSGQRSTVSKVLRRLRQFARETKFAPTALVIDVDPISLM